MIRPTPSFSTLSALASVETCKGVQCNYLLSLSNTSYYHLCRGMPACMRMIQYLTSCAPAEQLTDNLHGLPAMPHSLIHTGTAPADTADTGRNLWTCI